MTTLDTIVCLVLAVGSAVFLYLGWYPLSLFCGLFFFLLIASIALHILNYPLPRYIIGAHVIDDEEVIKKLKEEE